MHEQTLTLAWQGLVGIVAATGLVTAALSGLAVWLVLRFTKPMDAYSEEFAKQLARHQNIGRLVEEARSVTDAAENIKHQLSHENWDRQSRWTAKRDFYVQITQALGEMRASYATWQGLERLRLDKGIEGTMYASELDQKRRQAQEAMELALQRYQRATDAAPLMIPDEPYKPLRELAPRAIRFGTSAWGSDLEYNIAGVQWALYHFQVAARADLGFEPMVWRPNIISSVEDIGRR